MGTVDINSIVERTLALLRSSKEYETEFSHQGSQHPLWVHADAEQLQQVLINLVRNGAEAMDGRGNVHISTRQRRGKGVRLVEIDVSDAGPGIPRQARRNLFVPFFTTKANGTGLGLAVTDRIVQSMGGRIEVTSPDEGGATFTVILPAAEEPAMGVDRTEPSLPAPEATLRVSG